jgi:hypothetical protein
LERYDTIDSSERLICTKRKTAPASSGGHELLFVFRYSIADPASNCGSEQWRTVLYDPIAGSGKMVEEFNAVMMDFEKGYRGVLLML